MSQSDINSLDTLEKLSKELKRLSEARTAIRTKTEMYVLSLALIPTLLGVLFLAMDWIEDRVLAEGNGLKDRLEKLEKVVGQSNLLQMESFGLEYFQASAESAVNEISHALAEGARPEKAVKQLKDMVVIEKENIEKLGKRLLLRTATDELEKSEKIKSEKIRASIDVLFLFMFINICICIVSIAWFNLKLMRARELALSEQLSKLAVLVGKNVRAKSQQLEAARHFSNESHSGSFPLEAALTEAEAALDSAKRSSTSLLIPGFLIFSPRSKSINIDNIY